MAKYNIVILERVNKSNLIVGANRLVKHQPPNGGNGGHGHGGVKKPTLRDLILSMQVDISTIKQRLDVLKQNDKKIFDVLDRNNLH